MKISYDTLAKATYIELEKKKVAKTREFAPEVFLDFDYRGKLIGVELLNPKVRKLLNFLLDKS